MSNNRININGKAYPVHFGHHAMVNMLKLAKRTKFTEIGEVINDFPADKMPEAIYELIQNGIKVNGKGNGKDPYPTIDEITAALDENIMIWVEVLDVVSASIKVPEIVEEGNPPPPTTKQ